MMRPKEDFKDSMDYITNRVDLLVYFISIANNPEATPGTRELLDGIVKAYLEGNQITLREIYDNNFIKVEG